jgi:uncharacterized membrane protein YfcA
MHRALLFALFGAIAQAIDGSLGMGFGVTSSSLLLSLGVGSALASASVHLAELATSLISGVSHFRFGNVEKRLFWPLLVSGVMGAVAGTLSAVRFQDAPSIRVVVAGILLVLGVMIVARFARSRQHRHAVPSQRRLALIGFPAAFIDALGGGGWGPIATPSLLMSNVEPAKAVGTVNAVEFFVTLAISGVFLVALPVIDWAVAVPLAAGAALTAPFAAYVTRRMPTRALGTAVGIMIILLSARTIALALLW